MWLIFLDVDGIKKQKIKSKRDFMEAMQPLYSME